jgi:DnaJ-class molecular chaperone
MQTNLTSVLDLELYSRLIGERIMNDRYNLEPCPSCDGSGFVEAFRSCRGRVQPCAACCGTGAVQSEQEPAAVEESRELVGA